MEEIIKRSFCNYCLNKGNKCLEIQTEEKNGIKIYKCINYNRVNIPFNNNEIKSRR